METFPNVSDDSPSPHGPWNTWGPCLVLSMGRPSLQAQPVWDGGLELRAQSPLSRPHRGTGVGSALCLFVPVGGLGAHRLLRLAEESPLAKDP